MKYHYLKGLCLLALSFCLMPFMAKATPWYGKDYFEKDYNYSAFSLGSGRIHIKTLIFAEGTIANFAAQRGREHYWDDYENPRVWYQQEGDSKNAIFEYRADNLALAEPSYLIVHCFVATKIQKFL